MSVRNVRDALAAAFIAGAFFTDTAIAWENVSFDPPASTPWCSFTFVPNQPEVATLGDNGRNQVDGFVQISLFYPLNQGDKPSKDKADAICGHASFKAGSKLSSGGQTVVIRTAGYNQGRKVDGFYQTDITITWYSHIQR